eukprot:7363783-Lingulodinium_polyedra.AAC.1
MLALEDELYHDPEGRLVAGIAPLAIPTLAGGQRIFVQPVPNGRRDGRLATHARPIIARLGKADVVRVELGVPRGEPRVGI